MINNIVNSWCMVDFTPLVLKQRLQRRATFSDTTI